MAETIKQNTGKINCQWFYDLLVDAYLNGKDLTDKHLVVTKKQWGRWINEKKEINCTERNLAGFVSLMNGEDADYKGKTLSIDRLCECIKKDDYDVFKYVRNKYLYTLIEERDAKRAFTEAVKALIQVCNGEAYESGTTELELNSLFIMARAMEDFTETLNRFHINPTSDKTNLSRLDIKEDWLPFISEGMITLPDHIVKEIDSGSFKHIYLYCESGSGKTYSLIKTVAKLIVNKHRFKNTPVFPIFMLARDFSSIKDFFAALSGVPIDRVEKDVYSLFKSGDTHFVLFIDGINECSGKKLTLLKSEITDLAIRSNTKLTLVVSGNDEREITSDEWELLSLKQLDEDLVNAVIDEKGLDGKRPKNLIELLKRPFFLKTFRDTDLTIIEETKADTYSLIHAFMNTQIKRKTEGNKDFYTFVNDIMPKKCITQALKGERSVFLYNGLSGTEKVGFDYLISMGVIIKNQEYLFFKNDIYSDYFCAHRIIELAKSVTDDDQMQMPDSVMEGLMKELAGYFSAAISQSIIKIVAWNLHNRGILGKTIDLFGRRPFNDDIFLQATLFKMYSWIGSEISNADFSYRKLWLSDFTLFGKLENCNFDGCELNPETLWLLDTKIVKKSSLNEKINDGIHSLQFGNYIFIADDHGIEIYNYANDNKVYLTLEDSISDMVFKDDAVILITEGEYYRIPCGVIDELVERNTRDKAIKVEGLEGVSRGVYSAGEVDDLHKEKEQAIAKQLEQFPGLKGDVILVHSSGKTTYVLVSNEHRYELYSSDDPRTPWRIPTSFECLKCCSINDAGDVLFEVQNQPDNVKYFRNNISFILYRKQSNEEYNIYGDYKKASFLANGRVFLEREGVFEIYDDTMGICWRKTIGPVIPQFWGYDKAGNIVIAMNSSIKSDLVFFTGNFTEKRFRRVDNEDFNKVDLDNTDEPAFTFQDGKYEGKDRLNYHYYRRSDSSIWVYDDKGDFVVTIYGNLIDYSGSSFINAGFLNVDDETAKKYFDIIRLYGGMIG